MDILNTTNLKQFLLLLVIIIFAVVLGLQLYDYIPGVLGAITLYILYREWFFKITIIRGWKKWLTAVLFIVGSVIAFVLPFIGLGQLLAPKLAELASNSSSFPAQISSVTDKISRFVPGLKLGEEQIGNATEKIANYIPDILGAAGIIVTNLVLAFFLLYFMLVDGRRMERKIQSFLPLKEENTDNIWQATRLMVVSNAIGIPVLAASQAIAAGIGYWLFGIEAFVLWAVVTGVFSVLPVIGSALVWMPLCAYLFANGDTFNAVGLLIFSILVVTNVDNVLRFTLLQKLGDVHPIITVLGIMAGVPLFGFMGFIFGPLLISYLLLLVKIYRVEFSPRF